MAVHKLISSDVILAKVYRDFKPSNDEWVTNAIEWMGEGLEFIGYFAGYEAYTWCIKVKENRARVPCAAETIEGIEYMNCRLPKKGGINMMKKCNVDLPIHRGESYRLNTSYIQTTFEKGDIKVYGTRVPVDCNGFPMIPANIEVKEALTYYVLRQMMLGGFKHQVLSFTEVDALWERGRSRGFNSAMYPSIEDYAKFKDSWNNVIIDVNKEHKFFNTDGLESDITVAGPGTRATGQVSIIR